LNSIADLKERLGSSRRFAFGVFLAPGLILFLGLIIYPIVRSFTYSLFRWDGLKRVEFIWFENFETVLGISGSNPMSEQFWNAAAHNGYALVFVVVVQTIIGFGLALILFQGLKGTNFFRGLLFLPVTLSIVVVGYLFNLLLHPNWGAVNHLIRFFGPDNFSFPWLGDPRTALTVILSVNIWRWVGFPALIFLAGLNNIPSSIVDAARIDGAFGLRRILWVYLPLIIPQLLIVLILTITGNLKMFAIVYALTGPSGGPNYATDVWGTLFYRTSFGSVTGLADKGLGATVGIIIVAVSAVISVTVSRTLQRRQTALEG
jgi:raffinose/stachyose/melibiose transport system permease protein